MHTQESLNKTAVNATLHCLTGCAIGEIAGLIIGLALGLSVVHTIALAVSLAFLFGYALTTLPLLKAGMSLRQAIPVAFAADTVSIFTMEVVDNAIIASVPGAMESGVVHPLFWLTLSFALFVAFLVCVPVNKYMLARGKGHAAVHANHHNH